MRQRSGTKRRLTLIALVGAAMLVVSGGSSVVAQDATPTAGTPVAAPTAAPAAPATTNVVTLVAWYSNDPSGEFINVLPIQVGADRVASADPNGEPIGRAEFPTPDVGLPSISIGETTFTAYLRYEGDIAERWIWTDDTEGFRPATLVIQVQGSGGAYQDYYGTATFVSRDDLAGGVVVLALRPPDPAAEAAAAEDAAADDAAAEDVVVEDVPVDEAPVEEVPVEEPTAEPAA
jgi:hypothetical protein